MNRFVVISGCSGGGKSTLLAELGTRGFAVVEEPGRRVVKRELEGERSALPWVDLAAFARLAIETAIADRAAAVGNRGWTFFDRGLIDAAIALEQASGEPVARRVNTVYPYHSTVFVAPPWPQIYEGDADRRHSLGDAVAEYERLSAAYPVLGYDLVVLPKVSIAERADFVLSILG